MEQKFFLSDTLTHRGHSSVNPIIRSHAKRISFVLFFFINPLSTLKIKVVFSTADASSPFPRLSLPAYSRRAGGGEESKKEREEEAPVLNRT